MEVHTWKFLRLRPPNFPTIRIAQLASFLNKRDHPAILADMSGGYDFIEAYLQVTASEYWSTHYVFGKPSSEKPKIIGSHTIDVVIINTIVPVLLLRSLLEGNDRYREYAIQLLHEVRAEKNSVVSGFSRLGIHADNAFDSQGLLELKSRYCRFRRCLDCRIGYQILKK
jgi:hypothetical protein